MATSGSNPDRCWSTTTSRENFSGDPLLAVRWSTLPVVVWAATTVPADMTATAARPMVAVRRDIEPPGQGSGPAKPGRSLGGGRGWWTWGRHHKFVDGAPSP